MQIPHIWGAFFALGCCVLHRIAFAVVSEWYQEAAYYAALVPQTWQALEGPPDRRGEVLMREFHLHLPLPL